MNDGWLSLLVREGARFIDGRVADFGQPALEHQAPASSTVLCDLSHLGLIGVSGEEAASFLQGQFCNDVLALSPTLAQWNGWCTPKGRLLASFLLWRDEAGFFLLLPRALQPAIQKRLGMFVLRSKVKLDDVGHQWVTLGLAGPAAVALIGEVLGTVPAQVMQTAWGHGGWVIRLSLNRFVLLVPPDAAAALWAALAKHAIKVGAPVWDGLAIREGLLTVLPETQDQFVPQMVNFDRVGALSFKKGCYPGQEIVARTQYRGILKRRMAWVHGDSDPAPKPGDPVFAAAFGDQAAGQVAEVAPAPAGGFDALVVAQIEAIQSDSLRLISPDGAILKVMPLPYPLA